MTKQVSDAKDFTPSTGEESYLAKPEDYLPDLAKDINAAWADADMLYQKSNARMFKAGRLLNLARTHFTSDVKFGQWRKKVVEISQSHVQRLMQVAREFGDNEDAALVSLSTLAVLLPASPALKAAVIKEVKEGKAPTRAEVTERKKAEQPDPEPISMDTMEDSPVPIDHNPEFPPIGPAEAAQRWLDMPFSKRLAELEVRGVDDSMHNAFLIFGIPPYHEGMPSRDLIWAMYEQHEELEADLADKLTEAYDILMGLYT